MATFSESGGPGPVAPLEYLRVNRTQPAPVNTNPVRVMPPNPVPTPIARVGTVRVPVTGGLLTNTGITTPSPSPTPLPTNTTFGGVGGGGITGGFDTGSSTTGTGTGTGWLIWAALAVVAVLALRR